MNDCIRQEANLTSINVTVLKDIVNMASTEVANLENDQHRNFDNYMKFETL